MNPLSLLPALALLLTSLPAPAAVLYWSCPSNGVWNTTVTNWQYASGTKTVYNSGDDVRFGQNPPLTVTIQPAGVAPSSFLMTHYSCNYTFQGGDITGPTAINGGVYGPTFAFTGYTQSLSFAGGVTLENGGKVTWSPTRAAASRFGTGPITLDPAAFEFLPSVPCTLSNSLIIGPGGATLTGNTNAFWSNTLITVSGPVTLARSDNGWNYSGLDLRLQSDLTVLLTGHYQDNNRTWFNGIVSGNRQTTVNVANGDVYRARVGGPGRWPIAGLTKTGTGRLVLETVEVCGPRLLIESGKVEIASTACTQTLTQLFLGGVEMTAPGTYGATGSGALYTNNTWFAGAGVVTLVAVPTVSLEVVDSSAVEESGDPARFRLSRTGTSGALSVSISLDGSTTTAADYLETIGTNLVIPDGQSNVLVTVTPVNDSLFEDVRETLRLTLAPRNTYNLQPGASEGEVVFTDTDIPAGNILVLALPETAGLSGFRAQWDSPAPGALLFDAVHRRLLVRFPGSAALVARMLAAGHTLSGAELILPFASTEPRPEGYAYRTSMGIDVKWDTQVPRWHALAWPLRRPWLSDAQVGPTHNAYIRGAGFWTHFGAQDTVLDRHPGALGPAEVSALTPTGRLDTLAACTSGAFGGTLAERLVRLEECGWMIQKQEQYDFAFRDRNQPYEWGIEVGGRAIRIGAPRLELTFADAPAPAIGTWREPVDVRTLAATLHDGAPTATVPDEAAYLQFREQLRLQQPTWMPGWQWTRVQDLVSLQIEATGSNPYEFPETYTNYLAWIDELLAQPPRMWFGFDASLQFVRYRLWQSAMPAPVSESIEAYWKSYLMPHRDTVLPGQYNPANPGNGLVHPQAVWGEPSDTYFARTGDWEGNSSFYRSGYCRTISTMNFNHTATAGALLGGGLINAPRALADGRSALADLVIGLWTWANGSTQETIDHYYMAVTLIAQKVMADFAPEPIDRLMARIALLKTTEEVTAAYHPGLRRFAATSQRTSVAHLFATQDGLYHALNTLSPSGVQHDRGQPLPGGIPIMGTDAPAGLIALLTLSSPWAPDWVAGMVDEKPLPFQMTSRYGSEYRRAWLGRHALIGSSQAPNGCVPVMAQWKRGATPATNMQDVVTLLARYGLNTINWTDDPQNGVVPTQGGELNIAHHGRRMLIFGSPNSGFTGNGFTVPASITNAQTALALFNFQSTPSWDIRLDGVPVNIGTGPVTATAGQRIAIHDGVSYVGIIPLPATDLGRDAAVMLKAGVTQPITGGGKGQAAAALVIENYNFRSATPFNQAGADWTSVAKAYGGFAVEIADTNDFPDFAAFQSYLAAATLVTAWDSTNACLNASYASGGETLKARFIPASAGTASGLPYFRINGLNPYPVDPIERDSSLVQSGCNFSAPLVLSKNGATLRLDTWRRGFLQTLPAAATYAGHHVHNALSTFRLETPGGRSIESDGLVGFFSATLCTTNNRVTLDYSVREEDAPRLAERVLLYGFENPPVILRNGEPVEAEQVTFGGQSVYAVPLPLDDIPPRVSVEATGDATEGGTAGGFRLRRDATNGVLTVFFSQGGSAGPTDISGTPVTSATFQAGAATLMLPVTAVDDALAEGTETLSLSLLPGSNYWVRTDSTVINLFDNEPDLPAISISAEDPDAAETGANPALFVVHRNRTNAFLTVHFALGGSASLSDFVEPFTGIAYLPPGTADAVIRLTPTADSLPEGPETVEVMLLPNSAYRLASPTNASAIVLDSNHATGRALRWNVVAGGAWDSVSPNWTGSATRYTDGDSVWFAHVGTTSVNPTVTLQSAGVFPADTRIDHYNNTYTFDGGALRGPTALRVTGNAKLIMRGETAPHGFEGGVIVTGTLNWLPALEGDVKLGQGPIRVSGSTGGFAFQPALPARLCSPLAMGTGTYAFAGNANADWSGSPVTLDGSILTIAGNTEYGYTGLVLDMLANSQIKLTAHYSDPSRARFNAVVHGRTRALKLDCTGGGGNTSAFAYLAGPGHWDIGTLQVTGDRIIRVLAPEVVGRCLKLEGILDLADATQPQTVEELWLGSQQMTATGTYGSVDSPADFIDSAHFRGPGCVTLATPPPSLPTAGSPLFTPAGTAFYHRVWVALDAALPGTGVIRYTCNGADPGTASGTLYTAPFLLTTTTTVRAMVSAKGWNSSPVAARTYYLVTPVPPRQAGTLLLIR